MGKKVLVMGASGAAEAALVLATRARGRTSGRGLLKRPINKIAFDSDVPCESYDAVYTQHKRELSRLFDAVDAPRKKKEVLVVADIDLFFHLEPVRLPEFLVSAEAQGLDIYASACHLPRDLVQLFVAVYLGQSEEKGALLAAKRVSLPPGQFIRLHDEGGVRL